MVEIAVDHIAMPAVRTEVGPALSPLELGANKILAAYSREVARDYDDIAHLVPTLGWASMLRLADEKSPTPVDRDILSASLEYSARLPDTEFPDPGSAVAVKLFMGSLANGLRIGVDPGVGPFGGRVVGKAVDTATSPSRLDRSDDLGGVASACDEGPSHAPDAERER